MAHKIYGDTKGLASNERRALERLYRRRIPPQKLLTPELCRAMCTISSALGRQVAVIADRKGNVTHVILGDRHSIYIPDLSYYRRSHDRLKGLRIIHTHLGNGKGLDHEDITDMALLRLDSMVAVDVVDGLPGRVYWGHLLPWTEQGEPYSIETYRHPSAVPGGWDTFITETELAIQKQQRVFKLKGGEEKAILVHAGRGRRADAEQSLAELKELALSANVEVLETVYQRINRYNPAHLLTKGKLKEILIRALYLGATLVIFDQELSPVQVNNIAKLMDLKVIDRTQLILDIFARRARSREGKIQVELAQLRYLLPRLVGRGIAMSRLTGGIGGRGPGETKLEVDRRRIKQRITSLERELKAVAKARLERRKKRRKKACPVISIIGYTNAGKSTLLNAMTGSDVLSEDRLFATLDPTTRGIRLENGTKALLSDTVGFIRHMPKGLRVAFRSTLEELEDAALFLHVVDMTSPYKQEEMATVETILEEMGLSQVPRVVVMNKADLVQKGQRPAAPKNGVIISAVTKEGLGDLVSTVSKQIEGGRHSCNQSQALSSSGDHIYCEDRLIPAA